MHKRTDAQGFIFCHKPVEYGIWDNALYTPLEVGAALRSEHMCELRDDMGKDNLSEFNAFLAETSGTYWIWKNHSKDAKYILQCQYRRRLEFPENQDFDELFKDFDVIAASPLMYTHATVWGQYGACHCLGDMELVQEIIKDRYPEYNEDFEKWVKCGSWQFYANGFVMRAEDFDRYCKWLFTILREFLQRKGWIHMGAVRKEIEKDIREGRRVSTDGKKMVDVEDAVRYQSQVGGFLSERLLGLYLLHNFGPKGIRCEDYKKFEGV